MYAFDTTINFKHDSIETALANIHSPSAYYKQAFCRYNRADSVGVINILNNVASEFNLNDFEIDYNDYFTDFFNLLLTLQSKNKSFTQLDSTEKLFLNEVMNNTGSLLHAYTRNLLIYTRDITYHEPYIWVDTSTLKANRVHAPGINNQMFDATYFKLYPNPASEYITLEYKFNRGIKNPVIELLTSNGVHLQIFKLFNSQGIKIIDLRDYKPGIYILRLIDNDKTLQNEKFIKL